ncbi:hypothetical protein A9Q84_05230 [Halobacteriovorax marinus]|uniref:Acylneuraminate cytidylyltransferase n=1 Tax=Halobacteriovorax marinus TaxID=97084 RepID=A0A1Y5FB86_9BACT|nr:hypothetical protein A9Q84_05230 [Halobacteriovorax marinus]
MKILVIIPARKGSKRIPGKNTKELGGKTLIQWTLDTVLKVDGVEKILISTDDEKILNICKQYGVMAPWLRPRELSSDTASSVDVCLHALDWFENEHGKVDSLMLLQPTSPFRTDESIKRGIDLFKSNPEIPVIGFSRTIDHPYWCFKKDGDFLSPMFGLGRLKTRSQDLDPSYTVNGAFYLVGVEHFREKRSFYAEVVNPLIMNDKESIDIDLPRDWSYAESIIVGEV